MNTILVKTKLESLARCLERLRAKTPPNSQLFLQDYDAQDLVMKNLERAVRVCVDIANHVLADQSAPPPATMAGAFNQLANKKVISAELAQALAGTVGFHNLAVHEYENLDYQRVYGFVTQGLSVFEDFARAVLEAMER